QARKLSRIERRFPASRTGCFSPRNAAEDVALDRRVGGSMAMNRPLPLRHFPKTAPKTAWLLLCFAWMAVSPGCRRDVETTGAGDELTEARSALTGACTSSSIAVLDLQADFRDIWKGT